MVVDVRLIGLGSFEKLWDDYAPWLNGLSLLDAFDYELVDPLTRRTEISRADALALIDHDTPLPWHEKRVAEMRRNIWNAKTLAIELRLEEW